MVRPRPHAAMALALLAGGLAGCAGGSGPPTLNWYINPDSGGQVKLATVCTQASGGRFKLKASVLPTDASQQREQLVRRLAAKDSGLDLMSLDPPFVAEAANAGFLRPFSAGEVPRFTQGVLAPAVQDAMWDGKLYAAPFWANTQLLWFRKSVVREAGVDPTAPNFTWDQMIDAALKTGTTVGEQGNKYEGYTVWINALIASAGGSIITNTQKGADATVDIDSQAGRAAATIIAKLARSRAASPTLSTDDEEKARALFNGRTGGFMLNWPYIWAADTGDAASGVIPKNITSDIGWARYPQVVAGRPSKPPLGGIELAIGEYSKHQAEAVEAAACITSPANMTKYMLDSGNPSARAASYSDPAVIKQFPMAALIRDSINAAAPRPITPYYSDVSASIQSTWHPPVSVNPASTPRSTEKFLPAVLHDHRLL
jgi:ABC-type glycerol-3-phosphate transport system substrate-binding protein